MTHAIIILIIAGSAWFFYHEFSANWNSLLKAEISYNPSFLCIAFLLICGGYLVNTFAWQQLINHYATGRKIRFSESIAIVNTSQLTKYLPGKAWSFALQMWWMGEKGFSRPVVFFVNLIAMFSSLLATSLAGILLFSVTNKILNTQEVIFACLAGIAVYLIFILFYNPIINFSIHLIKRIFKKDISTFKVAFKRIIITQLLYISGTMIFAAGMYFVCFGLGMENNVLGILTVLGAILISDVIGFVVLISPGGLGIRESVMYLILGKVSVISMALIIPIATRVVTMLADLLLGLTGTILLRKFKKSG